MLNWKRVVWYRPVVSLVSVGLLGMVIANSPTPAWKPERRLEKAGLATARKKPELQ